MAAQYSRRRRTIVAPSKPLTESAVDAISARSLRVERTREPGAVVASTAGIVSSLPPWIEHWNGRRVYTVGWRLAERAVPGPVFGLDLKASRRESGGDGAVPQHEVGAGFGWRRESSGGGSFEARVEPRLRASANDDVPPGQEVGFRLTARW